MRKEFIENGFIVLPGFIDQATAISFANEFRKCADDLKLEGDPAVPTSRSGANFPLFVEYQHYCIRNISDLIYEPILPTYVFSRIYGKGDELKKHVDKSECEVSITINLDQDRKWPIWMKSKRGRDIPVYQDIGDAVLYQGCDVEHWRTEYTGDEYVQLFMHYVRSRGPCRDSACFSIATKTYNAINDLWNISV